MTWGWQEVATHAIVVSALVYLARKFVLGLSRKRVAGCAHCPSRKGSGGGSCHNQPVAITMAGPRPDGRKG